MAGMEVDWAVAAAASIGVVFISVMATLRAD
jgi:hypothetical protein